MLVLRTNLNMSCCVCGFCVAFNIEDWHQLCASAISQYPIGHLLWHIVQLIRVNITLISYQLYQLINPIISFPASRCRNVVALDTKLNLAKNINSIKYFYLIYIAFAAQVPLI